MYPGILGYVPGYPRSILAYSKDTQLKTPLGTPNRKGTYRRGTAKLSFKNALKLDPGCDSYDIIAMIVMLVVVLVVIVMKVML